VESITSGKLFRTRQGTLVLGVGAAVLAAIVLLVYLNQYRDSLKSTSQPLPVLVAKHFIPKGTSGDAVASTGKYQVRTLPKSDAQAGVFTEPSSLSGTVALKDIYPGQQLTNADFGTAPTTLGGQLTARERAVVVSLDSPSQVGGQITSGDRVDVYVLLTKESASGRSTPVGRLLLQNMYVMNSSSGGNVTLRATPKQAGELVFASENDKLWLTLRPTVGSTSKPSVIDNNTLLGR